MAPPAVDELEAMASHLVRLPGQEGALVSDDEELGVTFVRAQGSGPDLTYAARPRWGSDDWRERLALSLIHISEPTRPTT